MFITFTHCIKLVKLERVGIHCIVLFSRGLGEEGLPLQSEGAKGTDKDGDRLLLQCEGTKQTDKG